VLAVDPGPLSGERDIGAGESAVDEIAAVTELAAVELADIRANRRRSQ
jgi:hypothetical protein